MSKEAKNLVDGYIETYLRIKNIDLITYGAALSTAENLLLSGSFQGKNVIQLDDLEAILEGRKIVFGSDQVEKLNKLG